MSKGILIFALNSAEIDYVKVAKVTAALAKSALNLPVTLITNEDVTDEIFNNVIKVSDINGQQRTVISSNEKIQIDWKNQNRVDAYALSPYDETLLIDADYFIFNDDLLKLFDTSVDFLAFDNATDITNFTRLENIRLSSISITMYWATVIYFKKSVFADAMFSMMTLIRNNYNYYSLLYSVKGSQFRNDYALSIAYHALSGYTTQVNSIPGMLLTLTDSNINIKDGSFVFKTANGTSKICNANLHILDKMLIQNDSFLEKVKSLGKIA